MPQPPHFGSKRARPRQSGPDGATVLAVTASGARDDFKADFRRHIHSVIAQHEVLPEGPVILEVGYVLGPDRNWLDLWWSTLDALGPLLGQSSAEPEWHPRDGRVTDLGLHCTVDPQLKDQVLIALRATSGWLEPVPET